MRSSLWPRRRATRHAAEVSPISLPSGLSGTLARCHQSVQFTSARARWSAVATIAREANISWHGLSRIDISQTIGTWAKAQCGPPSTQPTWVSAVDSHLLDEMHQRMVIGWRFGLDDAHWLARSLRLQPWHSVMEIGCGAGRVGTHLIRFLHSGHYSCIEADSWSLQAQIAYELPMQNLLPKRPRYLLDSGLRVSSGMPHSGRLELIFAFASLKGYIARSAFERLFCDAARLLSPGGLIVQVQNLPTAKEKSLIKREGAQRIRQSADTCGMTLVYSISDPKMATAYDHSRPTMHQGLVPGGWGVWARKSEAHHWRNAKPTLDLVPQLPRMAPAAAAAAPQESEDAGLSCSASLHLERPYVSTASAFEAHLRDVLLAAGFARDSDEVGAVSTWWDTHAKHADWRCRQSAHRHEAAQGASGAWLVGLDDAHFVLSMLRKYGCIGPTARLLELACGSGRMGRHLIAALRPRQYSCIEADSSFVLSLAAYELPMNGLLHKLPRLLWADPFPTAQPASASPSRAISSISSDLGFVGPNSDLGFVNSRAINSISSEPTGEGEVVVVADTEGLFGRARVPTSILCPPEVPARHAVLLLLRPGTLRGSSGLAWAAAASTCGMAVRCTSSSEMFGRGLDPNFMLEVGSELCTYPALPHAPTHRWDVLLFTRGRTQRR